MGCWEMHLYLAPGTPWHTRFDTKSQKYGKLFTSLRHHRASFTCLELLQCALRRIESLGWRKGWGFFQRGGAVRRCRGRVRGGVRGAEHATRRRHAQVYPHRTRHWHQWRHEVTRERGVRTRFVLFKSILPRFTQVPVTEKRCLIALHWRHMGVGATQSINLSIACSNACSGYQQHHKSSKHRINSSSARQNGRHFADDIFRCIFVNDNVGILNKTSLKFVPEGPIDYNPASV